MSNSVVLAGNLTRIPELKYTSTGAAVTKFGLAVNRFYVNRAGERVEQTDFFNVTAWRQLAENVAETCTVGTRVIVTGRITSRNWETEDGQKRTSIEIDAEEVGASLRWATAKLNKVTRGAPTSTWSESAMEPPAEDAPVSIDSTPDAAEEVQVGPQS